MDLIKQILNALHTAKAALLGGLSVGDKANWHPVWTIEKYRAGETAPYAVEVIGGNLLLNAGITSAWTLIIGGGGVAFNNASARLGVGDSATASGAGQTGLQAAVNKTFKGMDATYPQVSGQTVTFKSTFAAADANYAWNEFIVDNSTTALNRKQEAHGTKASGDTWVLTLTITLS